mgnify:CR=1 FL=1
MCDALGYKNPEKALRVHVSLEDKGVNEMVTPGERNKPSSSTSRVSTPPPLLYGQQAEVMKRDFI